MMTNDATGVKWKWLGLPALVLATMVMALLMAPGGLRAEGSNAVANGDFEGGTTGWTCKSCTLSAGDPAESGTGGQWTTTSRSARAQLIQSGIALQPNTTYELSFWARSANGNDVRVSLMQHVAPRANYGVSNQTFNLTQDGQVFTHTFTTKGFDQPINDARLRFQAGKGRGVQYSIDNITLTPTDAPPPPPPPPPGGDLSDEILVFNRGSLSSPFIIEQKLSGFIEDRQVTGPANANWVTGQYAGFADGTLYYRARIISIPKNQPGMKLGFCFWENKFNNEECRGQIVDGIPGTELTWSHKLNDMWVKSPINWANPRTKYGFLVRNQNNKPVSAKKGWNWYGEDPTHWYPMQIHYTVVLVKDGGTFDGWENYGW